jgi:hypothetical protein
VGGRSGAGRAQRVPRSASGPALAAWLGISGATQTVTNLGTRSKSEMRQAAQPGIEANLQNSFSVPMNALISEPQRPGPSQIKASPRRVNRHKPCHLAPVIRAAAQLFIFLLQRNNQRDKLNPSPPCPPIWIQPGVANYDGLFFAQAPPDHPSRPLRITINRKSLVRAPVELEHQFFNQQTLPRREHFDFPCQRETFM